MTLKQGLLIGGGVALGGTGVYFGLRWLLPKLNLVPRPAPPTGLRVVSNRAVSTKNALLTVAIDTPSEAASGKAVTIRWYHYYPATVNGKTVLVPKFIAATRGPDYQFTFGKTTQAGQLLDGVTPGRPYQWGAQVCVEGVCSPIVSNETTAAAFAA